MASSSPINKEFHEKFLRLLEDTQLYEKGLLLAVNIHYKEHRGKGDEGHATEKQREENRWMFYDLQVPPSDLVKDLEKQAKEANACYDTIRATEDYKTMDDTNVDYDTIRATNKKIMIKDQRDMYGAIIQHVTEYQDKGSAMNVYLTNGESV